MEAFGWPPATATAEDDRVQPKSSRGDRLSSAAACRRAWSAVRVSRSQTRVDGEGGGQPAP